jgi:hypothetical protein
MGYKNLQGKYVGTIILVINSFAGIHAQNTGIGTNNPQQKLDVKGNLNVSGKVLVNQIAGQAGQVLMTNNAGNTEWGFPGEFKNVATYNTNASFTVPSEVTRIMVECWGGGGGATPKKGGGSGGYIRGYFTVSSAQIVTLVVGNGGAGSSAGNNGTTGGASTATVGTTVITANGGQGSTTSANGLIGSNGNGGGFTVTPSTFRFFVGVIGGPGGASKVQYTSNLAGNFYKETSYGNGGNSPLWPNETGGKGDFLVTGNAGYLEGVSGTNPVRPGGGGGCNSAVNNPGGAPGLIRVWY